MHFMETIHKHFNTIDSTNTWAKLNCHLFDLDKVTLITADQQTGGRGRFNREWVSPPLENIYATFCFSIDKSRKDLGNIPQVLSLSAAKILKTYGFKPILKWPNDILLSNKKAGGILCETVSFEKHLTVVIGIGLNINMSSELLEKIGRPATSLKVESGKTFQVKTVLKDLETQFIQDLEIFFEFGFKPFLDAYRNYIWTGNGKKISFHDNINMVQGFFHSINDDGTLNLTMPDGTVKMFLSGEFLPD